MCDWQPFRRVLRADYALAFPTSADQVVAYFQVRRTERAARSVYKSLQLALDFLDRVEAHPSISSAAKEAEEARAQEASSHGEKAGRGQAPPFPLAMLAAVEGVVVSEDAPLYHRAYAWYFLFRHWGSLRFDDTSWIPPATL